MDYVDTSEQRLDTASTLGANAILRTAGRRGWRQLAGKFSNYPIAFDVATRETVWNLLFAHSPMLVFVPVQRPISATKQHCRYGEFILARCDSKLA